MRVLLLFYLSPIWAVLMAWLFLGERLSVQARGVFALAIVGALIMLWDPAIGMPWPSGPGDWLAVSSGFAFALSNVVTRQLQQVSVQIKTIINSSLGDMLHRNAYRRLEELENGIADPNDERVPGGVQDRNVERDVVLGGGRPRGDRPLQPLSAPRIRS